MNKSNHKRKLLYGVGINDANYITQPMVSGVKIRCPFYIAWANMMMRCYCEKFQQRRPTYRDCTIDPEWHSFMNFHAWMIKQDWKGKQLDKDILIPGNKIYSPKTCVFVSSQINNLLTDSKATRGECQHGVSRMHNSEKFRVRFRINGKMKYFGCFDDERSANKKARQIKAEYITRIALTQIEPIKSGLLRHAELFTDDVDGFNNITAAHVAAERKYGFHVNHGKGG